MVKVIGDHEENVCENSPIFPSLEELSLLSLPNLVNFCGWRCAFQLPSLRNIEIEDCHRMESFTVGSLTTPKLERIGVVNCDKLHNLSLAKNGLLQLKTLSVGNCKSIEEVFFNVNENDGKCHITFPELEVLSLHHLPSLATFYKGIESIEFPLLREVCISCPKLTGFATSYPSVAGHSDDSFHLFCNQKRLGNRAADCLARNAIEDFEGLNILPDLVTFGSLQALEIREYENISNLWCHQIPSADFFSKLENLTIVDCGSIRTLFTSSIAANLVNLKNLEIWRCNEMGKVIGDNEENVCDNSQLMFPSLERLYLISLPNLVNFCGWRCALQLPSLREISIDDCPRMDSFTMGSLTTPKLESINIGKCEKLHNLSLVGFATSSGNNLSVAGHSDDSFHLFCHQKVTFGSLQTLEIQKYENISNLWCHQIPSADFFGKLEKLKIEECDSIRTLFTSSIAAYLVNLKKLEIWFCNEMGKVIGDDEENVCENSQLMFPSLEELELISLPNLVNFCEWRCALQLPSLMTVCIQDCHWMESFTIGSLSTPSLKIITIDSEETDVEDLNGAVQRYFRDQESAQTEREQEESNKEDQEDGERDKVETEEEEIKQVAEEN
ncbi:hypothetical protein BUALT_Bualt12G0033100 [Buddleja alternifolia]|uniref:Disease resistance protein At4g27190-like leucine-rich repeats domain-containing protein n=1 Tax=Buddleja alternifolia TaxID=168488 RepID=A0AAV6WUL3_9LAMI|nr:hypothetical protein BUALT_Bualt12G0033100 [Buddleja alternifolia]